MSLYDYHYSLKKLSLVDAPFYALLMAAIRKADTENLARLREGFPELVDEFTRRYYAPLGVLPEDNVEIPLEQLQEQLNAAFGDSLD